MVRSVRFAHDQHRRRRRVSKAQSSASVASGVDLAFDNPLRAPPAHAPTIAEAPGGNAVPSTGVRPAVLSVLRRMHQQRGSHKAHVAGPVPGIAEPDS